MATVDETVKPETEPPVKYKISIQPVANGWIVHDDRRGRDNLDFTVVQVFSDYWEMIEFLTDYYGVAVPYESD